MEIKPNVWLLLLPNLGCSALIAFGGSNSLCLVYPGSKAKRLFLYALSPPTPAL